MGQEFHIILHERGAAYDKPKSNQEMPEKSLAELLLCATEKNGDARFSGKVG